MEEESRLSGFSFNYRFIGKIAWHRSKHLLLENVGSRIGVEEQRRGEAWIVLSIFGEVLPAVRLISFDANEGISMSSGAFGSAAWKSDPPRVFRKL